MKIPGYFNKEDKALYRKLYHWMQRNVRDNLQEHSPWEVNTTALAEDCANNSGLIGYDDILAVLDDETHVIWDAAAEVAEWYEAQSDLKEDL